MTSSSQPGLGSQFRALMALVLVGLLVLFALQNLAPVELEFLAWKFESRRFLIIGGSFIIGLLVGRLLGWRRRH